MLKSLKEKYKVWKSKRARSRKCLSYDQMVKYADGVARTLVTEMDASMAEHGIAAARRKVIVNHALNEYRKIVEGM